MEQIIHASTILMLFLSTTKTGFPLHTILAVALAIAWAIVPMYPAMLNGIAGAPYTDLYPSVWSLWATQDWVVHQKSTLLGHPHGQNWYPSSIPLGIITMILQQWFSMDVCYNIILGCSRFVGAISFYIAARAYHFSPTHSMIAMIVVGCSPFVHGFSVEGIIEGTQIWPIAWLLWSTAPNRNHSRFWVVFFVWCSIMSNWYYGAIACVLWVFSTIQQRANWVGIFGIIASLPCIYLFTTTFAPQPIDPDIIRSMGFQWGLSMPHFQHPQNFFAMNNFIGCFFALFWLCNIYTHRQPDTSILEHAKQHPYVPLLIVSFVLSLGVPLLQQLPIISMIRFPYRWHLLTLIAMVWSLPSTQRNHIFMWVLCTLIALEQIFLSPVPWTLPTSPSTQHAYTAQIDGPVLDLPGLLYRKPGEINPSRPRMEYMLYQQIFHKQPIVWQLDFNGLQSPQDCFLDTLTIDPYSTKDEKEHALLLQQNGNTTKCWEPVEWVVIHNGNVSLNTYLTDIGFTEVSSIDTTVHLWYKKP